jgi:hypothetical protein
METQNNENQAGAQAAPEAQGEAMAECPMDAQDSKHSMSNFDHEIDDGLEADLRAGMKSGYAAMNFYGRLWFRDGKFHCQVMQHYKHTTTISADTLQQIMDEACERFGAE